MSVKELMYLLQGMNPDLQVMQWTDAGDLVEVDVIEHAANEEDEYGGTGAAYVEIY